MKYTDELLEWVFDRTAGRCHICGNGLCFSNFGKSGKRGAWEIEHSKPKSLGGTDNRNNLFPAHITCNRRKSNRSTRSARAEYGRTRAPYSTRKIQRIKKENAILGGFGGLLLASIVEVTPWGLLFLVLGGAFIGNNIKPED